jgi:DNA repair exonuclease SbcCD ATPase subunit
MKKFISILFCLFMFPLFLNTSQVNAQSDDPRNIMNSESVDFNKETLQLHTRIAELEGLLSEANAKISDLESTLGNMVTSEKYAEAERQLEVANAKISDLESTLGNMVKPERHADVERLLKEANAKISELGSRLAESDQSHYDKVEKCVTTWRHQEWLLFKDKGAQADKWLRGLNCCLFRGRMEGFIGGVCTKEYLEARP